MSLTLYELTNNYLTLLHMAEDSDTPTEAILDTLEAIKDELPVKVENTAKVIRSQKLNIEKVKAEIDRLTKIKDTLQNKVDNLESYLQTNMTLLDLPEVKTPTMTIKLVNNPASVQIDDVSQLPRKFIKTEVKETPDKKAIKEAIANGENVPGASITNGKRLSIK